MLDLNFGPFGRLNHDGFMLDIRSFIFRVDADFMDLFGDMRVFGQVDLLQNLNVSGNTISNSFIKQNGLSTEFLKADGSVDNATYLTATGTAANVSGVVAIANGGTAATTAAEALTNLGAAPIDSPTFIGIPLAPTPINTTNTTQIATTAFIQDLLLNAPTSSSSTLSGAIWTSATTGTLNGIGFTVGAYTMSSNPPSLLNSDYSTADYASNPLSATQETSYFMSGSSWTVTFNSPISNLKLYVYWRASGIGGSSFYRFDQAFSIASGSTGMTNSGNDLNISGWGKGILEFSGPITTLTLSADGTSCCSGHTMTFASGVGGIASASGTGQVIRIDSPNLEGIPTAPTAAPGTNTTQIATTAFVTNAVSAATSGAFVDLTSNQNNISGNKTFTNNIAANGINIGKGSGASSTILGDATSANDNSTAIGFMSLNGNGGTNNTAIGTNAMRDSGSTANTTAIGVIAGQNSNTGNNNTFLGYAASVPNNSAISNATAIGSGAIVTSSNTIQLGADGSNGTTPISNIKTSGTITAGAVTYPNVDGAAGTVLTANANGIPTWTAPSGGGGSTYTLPTASSTTLGGIKVGTGLTTDMMTGALSVNTGYNSGLTIDYMTGALRVNTGYNSGLTTDMMSGALSVNLDYNSGLTKNSMTGGALSVNTGYNSGLTKDYMTGALSVNLDNNSGLTKNSITGALRVNTGYNSGLTTDMMSGALSVNLDYNSGLTKNSMTGALSVNTGYDSGLIKDSFGALSVNLASNSGLTKDSFGALSVNLESPTFTGTPAAPTATAGTNTTQIATTAFVTNAVSTATSGAFVDLTSAQTVAGAKTFSDGLRIENKPFLPTKLNQSQINSLTGVEEGMVVYNTDTRKLQIFSVGNTDTTNELYSGNFSSERGFITQSFVPQVSGSVYAFQFFAKKVINNNGPSFVTPDLSVFYPGGDTYVDLPSLTTSGEWISITLPTPISVVAGNSYNFSVDSYSLCLGKLILGTNSNYSNGSIINSFSGCENPGALNGADLMFRVLITPSSTSAYWLNLN